MRTTLWLAILWASLPACHHPDPPPTFDEPPGALKGKVVLPSGQEAATTFVTVYARPAIWAPTRVQTPVAFATVPASSFSSSTDGALTASFEVTGLPPAAYDVSAIVDRDGDYSPFDVGLNGATCGDSVGTYEPDGPSPVVRVDPERTTGGVRLSAGSPLEVERPAFSILGPNVLSVQAARDGGSITFRIGAQSVAATYAPELHLDLAGPCVADNGECDSDPTCLCDPTDCRTGLPLWLVDADDDGWVDRHPVDPNQLDVWPRVYLNYLGHRTTTSTGEVVFDNDGVEWSGTGYPLGAELRALATELIPYQAPLDIPLNEQVQVRELSITLDPNLLRHDTDSVREVVHVTSPEASEILDGEWSVSLVGPNGQTWTLPNEVGLRSLPPGGLASAGQDVTLVLFD